MVIARCICLLMFFALSGADVSGQTLDDVSNASHSTTVSDLLDKLRSEGFPLVYSTNLVPPGLLLKQPVADGKPIDRARAALQPHGLDLQAIDGMYLVVRIGKSTRSTRDAGDLLLIVKRRNTGLLVTNAEIRSSPELPEARRQSSGWLEYANIRPGRYDLTVMAPGYRDQRVQATVTSGQVQPTVVELAPGPFELEELSVSASRYILFSNSQFFIDQSAIQALPDLGEDPIRSAHRLPGAAASGLSSRSHFRGGEHNETSIFLNGLQLVDPFHIRDYHSIFSSIDARAIAGVEAYTGGFPVEYGDSMSGVLVLDSQRSGKPRHAELGLSIYNTSVLFSGYTEDQSTDWLFSARRSNLSLVLSDDLGKPDYFDVFGTVGFDLSATTRLVINGLYADDQVVVTLESDPAELEQSISKTSNRQAWILLENEWTPDLSSASVLSMSWLENTRDAQVNDPEQLIAVVSDYRQASSFSLRQDWRYDGVSQHSFGLGYELRHLEARYEYQSQAEYENFFAAYPGIHNPLSSDIRSRPKGASYSLFLSDRWSLGSMTAIDLGLRWDHQTYTETTFSSQLSPRISLLHSFSPTLDLRLTWGRYHQSQAIQQLQVEDGVDTFFPAQRADHWIAGLQYRFGTDYHLRLEAFLKDYSRLKPRFENLYDSLALIPELEPDRVRLDPASATARGVELTLEYRGQKALSGWATYSLARVTDDIEGVSQPRSWDQRHAFQAGLAWQQEPWEVGLALSIHSGWPTTSMSLGFDAEEDEYFPVPGPRNTERLGTFATLDFRISREFRIRKGNLSAFFEVTNATNRRNECCIDYDLDEDDAGNVFLDRTVDDWLPLIPAVGILWEF